MDEPQETEEVIIKIDPDPTQVDDWDTWQQARIQEFKDQGITITHVEDMATFHGYRKTPS